MSERAKTVWTIIGVIGLIGLFKYYFHHGDMLHERAKYTIGYITGSHWAVKSGRQVDYEMTINGKVYKGGDDELPGMKIEGARYLVKYDSIDPEWKVVYYAHPVPDSIGEAPPNGWLQRFPV